MKKFDKLTEFDKSNYESVVNSLQLDHLIDYISIYGLDALIYELNLRTSSDFDDSDLIRFTDILKEEAYNDLYED